jgi:hypothetical protein
MPSVVTKYGATATPSNWTGFTAGQLGAESGTYAFSTVDGDEAYLSDFGFAVPANATITNLRVEARGYVTSDGVADLSVYPSGQSIAAADDCHAERGWIRCRLSSAPYVVPGLRVPHRHLHAASIHHHCVCRIFCGVPSRVVAEKADYKPLLCIGIFFQCEDVHPASSLLLCHHGATLRRDGAGAGPMKPSRPERGGE